MAEPPYPIKVTSDAENDLASIHAYMAAHRSADDADALIDRLVERMNALRDFPLRGTVPQEMAVLGEDAYRQIVQPPYRIIYHFTGAFVLILMIADGRRDMQALLSQRLLGQ
ncbi:type II toxin-antitoxin system RelE/ParE family toxin [Sphingobium terrigena]|uniref:Type II toxin-antitoxin system RelE/ParE family toxin n=1 Tax=Sphingobium terrigena TaxID=2304063 RepID=A0A418YR76_9SPHN|nr:type II toxin-antitoxin system RelE/ParE family toxin [Sphingobium terrigena]RJG54151.1 type II toxin-antitoxin system RelE/ParE family toxin [Sphingobium terrigena]